MFNSHQTVAPILAFNLLAGAVGGRAGGVGATVPPVPSEALALGQPQLYRTPPLGIKWNHN